MASNRYHEWLAKESASWLADGLVSESQVAELKARYPATDYGGWGNHLLTAMGAGLFGLGIILFFAYNWADLHKYIKLTLIFVAFLGAHFFGRYTSGRSASNKNLSEGFHVAGTMMFGAAIWLIAQIYNMDGHYPNAFAYWGMGALLMAWALPSVIQGLMAAVLIGSWGTTEVLNFGQANYFSVLVLIVGVLTLAWVQKSRALLFVSLLASISLLTSNILYTLDEAPIIYSLFALSLLLISASVWVGITSFPQSGSVLKLLGVLGYGFFLVVFGIDGGFDSVFSTVESIGGFWFSFVVCIATLIIWCVSAVFLYRRERSLVGAVEYALVAVSMLIVVLSLLPIDQSGFYIFYLIFNVIIALHGVVYIISGTAELRSDKIALGCFMIFALAIFRFNDLFDSLLMRSLAFVLVGAILFFIGHIHAKASARKKVLNDDPLTSNSMKREGVSVLGGSDA